MALSRATALLGLLLGSGAAMQLQSFAEHDTVQAPSWAPPCVKGPESAYTVAVIFAGRQDRMALTLAYLDRLVASCAVDEVHLWNATRTKEDERWLLTLADRRGYTVLFGGGDEPWIHAYEYYSSTGAREAVTAVGKEDVPQRFTPAWDGASEENTVIVKMDDDIVYIDVDRFPCFVDYVRTTPDMFLVHGNIVNNGVAAYYQLQQDPELRARMPELAKYPARSRTKTKDDGTNVSALYYGWCGELVMSPLLAVQLHEYFVDHPDRFVHKTGPAGERCIVFRPPEEVKGQGRYSINFFGARRSAWDKVTDYVTSFPHGGFDERALTTEATKVSGITECMFPQMVVAHLSFATQGEAGEALLPTYRSFAERQLAALGGRERRSSLEGC